MKILKVTKKMLKMHPADFLLVIGATNPSRTISYPQHVYMAKQDYETQKTGYKKQLRKKYPYISSNRVDASVGMEFLNYGASELLSRVLKPGNIIVDEQAIYLEFSKEGVKKK